MQLDNRLIGIRIMQKRKEKSITQEQLAEKLSLSKNHISSMERGKCLPTASTILDLCEVLGGTPDYYLIGRIDTKTENDIVCLLSKCPPDNQKFLKSFIELYIGSI